MEPALVEIIQRTIASLAPGVQAQCNEALIQGALHKMGAYSVEDVRDVVLGDI